MKLYFLLLLSLSLSVGAARLLAGSAKLTPVGSTPTASTSTKYTTSGYAAAAKDALLP